MTVRARSEVAPRRGFRRHLIRLVGRADALGDVAPAVVRLQEGTAPATGAGGHAAVPHVGDEQRDVAGFDLEHHRRAAVVREVFGVHPLEGREATRPVAPRHDRGGSVGQGAVLQVDVGGDREDRVRDAIVPGNTFRTRDVRARVAVPGAAREIGRVAPSRVRDDVAVVAEKWLDDGQDRGVRHRGLAGGAAVEHLVAELVA